MVSNRTPLRYRISDWGQLDKCLSNNSRHLKIVTTVFLNDDRLNGLRIRVDHEEYGTLFACVLNAKGTMITPSEDQLPEFTPAQVLCELKKYGFDIVYNPAKKLPGNQIEFLMTLRNLNFDKIRIMNVWDSRPGVKKFKMHIVVFNAETHIDWLNSGYSPSIQEFTEALNDGSAMNVTKVGDSSNRTYNWTFLYNFVANIDDIIKENSGAMGDWDEK